MFRYAPLTVCALAVVALACSRATTTSGVVPAGVAALRNASGVPVGTAMVSTNPGGGVRLVIEVKGLNPGKHGLHVHSIGQCDGSTATPFSSASGHFNPTGKQHGKLNPLGWHAGDLPNVVVDDAGNGSLDVVVDSLTIADGSKALFDADGSAIVIHANEDDERTDNGPAGPGNSGARVACGVLARP